MLDRIDRSLDRNGVALFIAPVAALLAFALSAVALEPPLTLREWPGALADIAGGMVLYGWFLLPVPFLLVYGLEAVCRTQRTSLLLLSPVRVLTLGVAFGWLTMLTVSLTIWPAAAGRGPVLGAAAGLIAAGVILALRDPRAAS